MMCPSRGANDLLRSSFFWVAAIGVSLGVITYMIFSSLEEPFTYEQSQSFTRGLKSPAEKPKKLIIGVLSAQDNFQQRQAVRDTWGKLVVQQKADVKFIVGSEFCPLPQVDRATPYICEEWTPVVPADNIAVISNTAFTTREDIGTSYVGFTFIVKQNISITQLSLSSNLLTSAHRIARVVLIDALANKIVTSATFAFDPDANIGCLRTKRVPPVRLPIQFEGELRIISSSNNRTCPFMLEVPSAVYVFELLDSNDQYLSFMNNRNQHTVCGGFSYSVEDRDLWKAHLETKASRLEDWNKNQELLKTGLVTENGTHGDILFANVVDVYANLIQKTMFLLLWASSRNYDFVLKTDDDVYLDIPKIFQQLEQSEPEDVWDWWSCFKVGWPAPNAGKWRDRLSEGRTYPTFPSGSGYVIRMESVRKMLARPRTLVPVGEDVAVGLLAEGLNFETLDISHCFWSCNANCSRSPCNAPELTPELMKKMWQSYNDCNEICDCSI